VFNQIGLLAELMKNAGKLRESFQSIGQLEAEGSSGGGAVKVRVNGRLDVLSVRIDPKLVADADTELMEDLVAAAVNDAMAKAREAAQKSLAGIAGVLPMSLFPDFGGAARPGGRGS
jgi:DNA-binding YbaB/EbfC family protein